MPARSGGSSSADRVHSPPKPLVHTSGKPSEGDLTLLVQPPPQPPPPQRPLRPRRSCCARRPSPRCLAAAAAVLLLLCFHWERPVGDINAGGMAATDARFVYEGRWLRGESSAEADWPCSSVRFAVGTGGRTTAAVTLVWSGVRVRLNATVHDSEGGVLAAHTLKAPAWDVPFLGPHRAKLPLPEAAAEVRLRKLSCAAPFQMGIGQVLTASKVSFHGLVLEGGAVVGDTAPQPPARRLQVIGASDTAGFCVDGSEKEAFWQSALYGWSRSNCDFAYPALLGRRLGASVSVQGQASIGLTQNAMARQPYLVGPAAMPTLFARTLLTDARHRWPARGDLAPGDRDLALGDPGEIARELEIESSPHLVVTSLGGNDYNHQGGDTPSNASFTAASAAFTDSLFERYANPELVVIHICGMGSPAEAAFDPDNNRCRPCPHVRDATTAYVAANPTRRVHYLLVPCNGSVVDDVGDIGCNGHKNRLGQAQVADFLEPRIRSIMGW